MIIRVWTAHATPEGAENCQARFVEQILPRLKSLAGYLGASLLRRPDGDEIELVLLTRWKSLEAVRPFAGPDIERAVVDTEAAAIMTRWDPRVRHYEVALEDGPSAPGARRRAPSTARSRQSKRTSPGGKRKR
jgi:heme-degrading monooxygenase HmoA